MTPNPAPHPSNDLDPALESLLRASDPANDRVATAMVRSRSNTSGISAGHYAPPISQSVVPPPRPATDDASATGSSSGANRSSAGPRWGVFLAVAASAALVAGVAVFGPWADSTAPAPGPAAPPPVPAETTAPEVAPSYFNPLDGKKMAAFTKAGGERMVGRLRAALPADPGELRATGWVFELYVKSGSTPTADLTPDDKQDDKILVDSDWVPIDLGMRSTSLLGRNPETGDLVIVYSTNLRDGILEAEPGPYGVLFSDQSHLAAGSLKGASSARTLDGEPLEATAVDLGVPYLVQFAAFGMKYGFSGTPEQAPSLLRAKSFHSQTGPDATSCVSATTALGDRILSFPTGSKASIDMTEIVDDPPVLNTPLRITPPVGPGQSYATANFSLDTTKQRAATLKVWPTGTTGTCGDRTGEIVKFAGLKK